VGVRGSGDYTPYTTGPTVQALNRRVVHRQQGYPQFE